MCWCQKWIFLKKNIIWIYFGTKSTLKSYRNRTPKQAKPSISKDSTVEIEKRKGSDQCGSNCSVSGRVGSDTNSTNLDRFLEYTTPVVPAQFLPKVTDLKKRWFCDVFCWFLFFIKVLILMAFVQCFFFYHVA